MGFDFVIPISLTDGRLSALFVQIKNTRGGRIDPDVFAKMVEAAADTFGVDSKQQTKAIYLVLQFNNGEETNTVRMAQPTIKASPSTCKHPGL